MPPCHLRWAAAHRRTPPPPVGSSPLAAGATASPPAGSGEGEGAAAAASAGKPSAGQRERESRGGCSRQATAASPLPSTASRRCRRWAPLPESGGGEARRRRERGEIERVQERVEREGRVRESGENAWYSDLISSSSTRCGGARQLGSIPRAGFVKKPTPIISYRCQFLILKV